MRIAIVAIVIVALSGVSACDAETVPRADYDALMSRVSSLEATVADLQTQAVTSAQKDNVQHALAGITVQTLYDLTVQTTDHADRLAAIEALDIAEMSDLAVCEAQIGAIGDAVDSLAVEVPRSPLEEFITLNPEGDIVFRGTNVRIESGSEASDGEVNGKGNLIIGYGETADEILGSHNVLIGPAHTVDSYGGLYAMSVEVLLDEE